MLKTKGLEGVDGKEDLNPLMTRGVHKTSHYTKKFSMFQLMKSQRRHL